MYKNLGLYTEAFTDLDMAEDIIGGANEHLDHVREAIQKEREEIQKETLLKEKMRRAAGHVPISERLHASILRSLFQALFDTLIGRLIIMMGLLIVNLSGSDGGSDL